jgi:hypothetical protein
MFEIWKQLSESGYTTKTFEEFKNEYSSEEGQNKLYEGLLSEGLTSKSFDDFSNQYFVNPPEKIKDVVSQIKALPGFDQQKVDKEKQERSKAFSDFQDYADEYLDLDLTTKGQRPIDKGFTVSLPTPIGPNIPLFNISDPIKGRDIEELSQDPKFEEELRGQILSNYKLNNPNAALPDDFTIDQIVRRSINAKTNEVRQDKKYAALKEKEFLIENNQYIPFLNEGTKGFISEMTDAEQRAANAKIELTKLNNQLKNTNSFETSYAELLAKKVNLEKQFPDLLKELDSDYKPFLNLETGQRINAKEAEELPAEMVENLSEKDKKLSEYYNSLPAEKLEQAYFEHLLFKQNAAGIMNQKVTSSSPIDPNSPLGRRYTQKGYKPNEDGTFTVPLKHAPYGTGIFDDNFIEEQRSYYKNDQIKLAKEAEALKNAYFLNIDPASIKEDVGDVLLRGAEVLLEATAGEDAYMFGTSKRKELDELEKLFIDSDIELTKEEKENFERSLGYKIYEQGIGFLPEMAKFAGINKVAGAAGITARIGQLINSGNKIKKAAGITLDVLFEEAKFKIITQGESQTGTGAGFKLGGMVFGKLIPFRFTAESGLASFNPVLEKVVFGGMGGATASEVALLTEALYKELKGSKDWKTSMEDEFGSLDEVLERMLINVFVFGLTGVAGMTEKSNWMSMSTKRKYQTDLRNQLITEGLSKSERNKIIAKLELVNRDINIADRNFLSQDIGSMQEARKEAEKIISLVDSSPADVANAKNYIIKVQAATAAAERNIRRQFENIKKSGIAGEKDIKLKIVDTELPNGDKATYNKATGEFTFNINKYKPGLFAQEFGHFFVDLAFKNNPEFAKTFKNKIAKEVNSKLSGKKFNFNDKKGLTFEEVINEAYEKSAQPEEYVMNLVEFLNKPEYRDILLETNLLSNIKDNVIDVANRLGLNYKAEKNFTTAQQLLKFIDDLGTVAEGGNSSAIKRKFEAFKNIIIDGKKLIDLKTGQEILTEDAQADIMASAPITESEKKDIFSKAEKAYEQFAKDNIDSAGLMVGVEFEPIISKMADRIYRDVPGYEMDKQNIISDVMMETRPGYGGVPALVKSWSPEGGAKLTSYVFGNLPKRIIGIVNKHYPHLGKTRGFEEGESAKFTEDQGLGGESRGFVDISSPELTTRVNAKKAETVLGLKPESIKEFDRVAEMETKFKFPDIEAKNIIEYNLGEKGNASVSYYANNTANVIINGNAEKIKARTPKDVEQYLNKKGFTIESQEKIGNFRQQKINSFRTQLYDVLQAEAGGTINKGTAASPEYSAFIDRSFTLYKDYFSQSSINKRFADFKEPVIDKVTGKQAREKTAQGNPIFTKKNITKAEWIKYFEGDGNIRIDARRRALLETIAEEIGFDKIMEKVYDQSKQEQIRSRQAELGVELVENFAVILGKQLDRLPGDQIVFASKDITEAFDNLIVSKEASELENIFRPYGSREELYTALRALINKPDGWLADNHPELFTVIENIIAKDFPIKINKKENKNFEEFLNELGVNTNELVIKQQNEFTNKELGDFASAAKILFRYLPKYLFSTTEKQKSIGTTGSYIGKIIGFDYGRLTADLRNKLLLDKELIFGKDFELIDSEPVKKAWEVFANLTKNGREVFAYKTSNLGFFDKMVQIDSKPISRDQKIKEAEAYRNTPEGKEAIRVAKAQKQFLKATILTIDHIAQKDSNFKKNIVSLFRFNQGTNLIRYFSPIETIQFTDGKVGKLKNEHNLPKARFAAEIYADIVNGTLTPERVDQLQENFKSTIGPEAKQSAIDKLIGRTFYNNLAFKMGLQGEKVIKRGKVDTKALFENLKSQFNLVEGKTEYDILIEKVAKDLYQQLQPKNTSYTKFENIIKENAETVATETFASKDITEEFDNMLTRRTGLGGEISPSRARQLGKGKGKFDLYIPPNAEDFAGLLYKLYGKGKQGDADMALARETLLLPYERGENAISTYRQQISEKFKDFNKKLKAFDMKFDKDAVRSIENAGFTVDQAIRVWIWEKLGYDIPNITLKEQTELSNIVSKNPKLLASAISFKNMFGAGRPYPEPKGDWYASNIKFDAHRYINEGARKMFLEEFITNADAIFTPEFYSKAEAGLGRGWVKNMKEMLNAMKTGQSMPTNLPEYATIGLNYINGAVGNIMFLNGRSATLQTISMANFVNWSDNNILAVGKTLADPKNFGKTFMELMNSDFLKQRRDGLEISVEEAEIAKSLRETKNPLSHVWGKIIQMGYTPTKFADSFAIAAGGTPFYINRTKTYESQGFSNAEAKKMAFDDFRMLAETHQQSSRQDKVSNVQRGLTGRLVYSFSGAPFQMAREQKKAALDFINRRGDDKTNISKFIYYGAMQNLLFTALQQGIFAAAFEDDEVLAGTDKRTKRLANSMLDTGLRSSGLPGAMLAMGKNAIIKYMEENEKGYQGDMGNVVGEVLNISPPVGAKFRNIYKGLQSRKFLLHTKKGRAEVEASNNFIENPLMHANARILGGITNYPVNRLMTKADNLTTAYTGLHRGVEADAWQRVFLAAGWDKWSLGFYEKAKEEGPKKSRSERMKEVWAEKRKKEWQEDSIKNARMLLNVKPTKIKKINF